MCIAIGCFSSCDVINFEINLTFLIKPFSYMTKSQELNLNILGMKRAFNVKQKTFSIIFKGLSVASNCLKPESGLLIKNTRT